MSISQKRLLQVLAVSALALGLSACGPSGNESQTTGQKLDNAIEKTEQAAENAKVEAERAAETAGQKIENAVEATKDAATNAADATKDAVSHAADAAGDAGITAKVKAALVGDAELSALKINVDTKDGAVTIHGEAPSQAAKDRAEQLAKAVEGVKSVNNLLLTAK